MFLLTVRRRDTRRTFNSRRSDLANERLPMFEPTGNTNFPVIPAPSMRRRGSNESNDLEELGMEIRKLEEGVDNMGVNVNAAQQQRRSERVVETKRKVTTRKMSLKKRYEGA
ncbi:hypothetical protein J3R83DRAFT_5256 [Lanmaoa asiatica]|nr:hypothetical protein J3R83DRAFT_5256 [Lanmaoa asiatica]